MKENTTQYIMTGKWFKIAWRNVYRNKRRSLTAVLTIAIATTAMICTQGYVAFSFWSLQNSIIQGGTGNMQVMDTRYIEGFEEIALEYGIDADDADILIQKLESLPQVKLVTPRITFTGLLSVGEGTTIFSGEGVNTLKENALRGDSAFGSYVKGSHMQGDYLYQIELAIDLARRLEVGVGDRVTVLATTAYGGMNAIDATVVGVYTTGVPEQDRLSMRVSIPFAQELMDVHKVSRLVIELNDYDKTDMHRPLIDSVIGYNNGTQTWAELVPFFKKAKQIYTTIFSVMGGVLVTIVLLSIYNVMHTVVLERVSEIGTLRAFGISQSRIIRNFVNEGVILSILGGILGTITALVIVYVVNTSVIMLPPPPARALPYQLLLLPDIWAIVVVILVMCGLSICASVLAVKKVVGKKVVEQLSYR